MGDYVSNQPPQLGNQKPASECGSRISGYDLVRRITQKVAQKIDQSKKLGFDESEATRSLSGADVLQYMKMKRLENSTQKGMMKNPGAWRQRDLFYGRPDFVPNNSDVESTQTC